MTKAYLGQRCIYDRGISMTVAYLGFSRLELRSIACMQVCM